MIRIRSLVAFALLCILPALAHAQAYPAKPVRVIVPYPAGGSTDVLARMVSPRMAEAFGQPVIVDNRAGAAGQIAAAYVAKEPADGYTLLLFPVGLAIFPATHRKLPFDALRDFTAVTQLTGTELVMVTNASFAPRTVQELVALAKTKPGGLNYGSNGVGDIFHLTMEMFNSAAGVKIVNVPYKGDAQLSNAIIAGEVPLAVTTLASVNPYVQAGKLRLLAATGPKRIASYPSLPTVSESGLAGFESSGWQGFFVASATPRDIVQRVQVEAVKALRTPEVLARMEGLGWIAVGSSSQEFDAMFRREVAKFRRIVQDASIPMID